MQILGASLVLNCDAWRAEHSTTRNAGVFVTLPRALLTVTVKSTECPADSVTPSGSIAIEAATRFLGITGGPLDAQPANLHPTCTEAFISVASEAVEPLLVAVQIVPCWSTGTSTRLSTICVVPQDALRSWKR
jgi:hypothetical protein